MRNADADDRHTPGSTMSGMFKTGRDGRKLFFPWGPRSTSFVIPTQERYRRLRLQVATYKIISLGLIVGAAIWLPFYVTLGVAVLTAMIYSAWTPSLVRGLALSAGRMSSGEGMAAQARGHHAMTLWLLEIVALVFVAAGAVILVANPDKWMMATASIVTFGACALFIAYMLVLRRRAER
jgi:hypothetical protein